MTNIDIMDGDGGCMGVKVDWWGAGEQDRQPCAGRRAARSNIQNIYALLKAKDAPKLKYIKGY